MPITAAEIIFFSGILLICYTYFGYALLFKLLPKKPTFTTENEYPAVTLILPVHNEDQIIEEKIRNSFEIDYPKDLLTCIFIDDGSTDRTAQMISQYQNIQLITHPVRKGKAAAINTAMQKVRTPIVVFTDANAMIDSAALKKLMRHFGDPVVGGVSGEKKIQSTAKRPIGHAEKLYWQYEAFLKKADSTFYSVVGADGALFAIRTVLFKPLKEDTILDDFFISVGVCEAGYRFVYESEAFAQESTSITLLDEQKRKIRISAGCFQALSRLKFLLHPLKHFRLFLIYVSHRVLRWTAPLLLIILFITNFTLALTTDIFIYDFLFLSQVIFYLVAAMGWVWPHRLLRYRFFLVPHYFVFMNISLIKGAFRYISGAQSVIWEKSGRIS